MYDVPPELINEIFETLVTLILLSLLASASTSPMAEALGQSVPNAASSTNNPYAASMQQATAQTTAATSGQEGYANATEMAAAANQQLNESLNNTQNALKQTGQASEDASKSIKKSAETASQSSGAFGKLASGIGRSFSQILRIAKSMLIRTAIRSMMKGAKEGLDNYYNYSKTVGNGFSQTMDQMAGTAAQMKNQLGAALASALSTLAPVLNALADAALWCLNAITALFAALGGKDTYSRATKQTTEYTKATKAAGGATKELLASFDELNVIASQGGGGGGGASSPDYGSMFEEVPVPEWAKIGADLLPWIGGALALVKALGGLKWLMDLFDKIKGTKLPEVPQVSPAPDWTSFITQLQEISTKISGINTEIGAMNTAIVGLNTVTTTWQTTLWVCVAAVGALALAVKLVSSPKITAKLDRDDFDRWVEDLDALTKDLETPRILKINTKADLREWQKAALMLNVWITQNHTKKVKVTCDLTDFYTYVTLVETWIAQSHKKYVGIGFDPVEEINFWAEAGHVVTWCQTKSTKLIYIEFDKTSLIAYQFRAALIENWANEKLTKTIDVVINIKYNTSSATKTVGETVANGIASVLQGTATSGSTGAKGVGTVGTSIADKKYMEVAKDVAQQYVSPGGFAGGNGVTITSTGSGGSTGVGFENLLKNGLIDGRIYASGAYGIPRGDLFIANEAGAELVGSINGKSSVANQEQIIAGIQRGVAEANGEQNTLLRQQNELLRRILEKESSVRLGASAALGRVARQSLDMYAGVVGG